MRTWGEMGFIELLQGRTAAFLVREVSFRFSRPDAPRTWWFWDGTIAALSEQGMVAAMGILAAVLSEAGSDFFFVLTRRPRGWLLFLSAAALIIYPTLSRTYYLASPVAKYRTDGHRAGASSSAVRLFRIHSLEAISAPSAHAQSLTSHALNFSFRRRT